MSTLTPLLAAGDFSIWPFVIAGIVMLFKLLGSNKESAGDQASKPPPPPPPPRRPPSGVMTEEEERQRRFREVLGLPPDGPNIPPPQAAGPRPQPVREESPTLRQQSPEMRRGGPPSVPPVPPIIAGESRRRRKERPGTSSLPPPPPLPRRAPAFPRETPSLDSLETTNLPVEQIHLRALETPEYHEFRTRASQVSAIPSEAAAYGQTTPSAKKASSHDLRSLLRDPASIRSAFLLREILGPPLGLQTPVKDPSLPSP